MSAEDSRDRSPPDFRASSSPLILIDDDDDQSSISDADDELENEIDQDINDSSDDELVYIKSEPRTQDGSEQTTYTVPTVNTAE